MGSNTLSMDKLRSKFELLRNIIRHSKHTELKVDLSRVEAIIHLDIPQTLQHHAPADFHVLFNLFKSEYERFKDFILYDKLIGKNIIALGGGFSSGKSSFLNSLMGKNVLPSDIDPSTSVPTYIVSGPKHQVQGINVFDTKIEMELYSIRQISHGFGKLENDDDEAVTDVVTLGHILNSIFFSTPLHQYGNIAFLDTPGYSKADDVNHTAKTDEQIARSQLNASNFILWFVQADAGTITTEDIAFINSLHKDIPKLIIVNKADKKTDSELSSIISNMKQVLDLRGIRYVDVLAFSNREPELYDSDSIRNKLEQWNKQVYESSFARNFKTIFMRCRQYYEDELDQESRRLNQLNIARTIADDQVVIECLDTLVKDITRNISEIKRISSALKQLQLDFFSEIKLIADIVGIAMPEPSEIELIQDKSGDPLEWLNAYKQKKGIRSSDESLLVLKDIFSDIKPVMNKLPGGSQYIAELMDVIRTNCVVEPNNIRIHDTLRTNSEYEEMFKSIISISD